LIHESSNFTIMIGMLAVTAIPTVIGVSEGVSEQRKADKAKTDERRMAKFHLDASCEGNLERAKSVRGKRAVVRDGKASLSWP
jgi:hypothetical protein